MKNKTHSPKPKHDVAEEYLNKKFQISPDFQRFNQRNDMFNRSMSDNTINPKQFYDGFSGQSPRTLVGGCSSLAQAKTV